VADTVALDTSENSIPYLASWAESASLDVLEQTAKLTDRLARRIEHALLAEPSALEPGPQEDVDAAQAIAGVIRAADVSGARCVRLSRATG